MLVACLPSSTAGVAHVKHVSTERREARQLQGHQGDTMTMLMELGQGQGVSCCQLTQATVWTTTTGTQCSLRLFSSTGAQTGEEFSGREATSSQPSVSFERLPTVQLGVDNTAGASAQLQGNHAGSSFSHISYTGKPDDYKGIPGEGKLHPCRRGQQCSNTETASTIRENLDGLKTPYTCSVCKKIFKKKRNLALHSRVHTGERPYVCRFCQKGFTQKKTLITHERVHTGENPFVCSICQKGFKQRDRLVKHARWHTGEKPYFGNKNFLAKMGLSNEVPQPVGKPFVCSLCEESFPQKQQLVTHMRLHAGDKPHFCNICQKRFTTKRDLNKHKQSHLDKRPHVCGVCYRQFAEESSLFNHEKWHSGVRNYL
ncbi:uncharacterized protein LOC144158685 isoform X2 [Haemaphysalis longicornis]